MTLAAKVKGMAMGAIPRGRGSPAAGPSPKQSRTARSKPLPGRPMELEIALIDEDPCQPRSEDNPGFQAASLTELATTVKLRGVKTPISVRDNPQAADRYIINHGARRFRASKLAGKSTIPAFIDNDYSDADQVVENLQRDELTPREIADFIGRELSKGIKKGDIAKSIGKSAAFVTQHVTLLDLPQPIAAAFNSGRARDVTVINELVTCFKVNPDVVTSWLDGEAQDITRTSVRILRDFIDDKGARGPSLEFVSDESPSLRNSDHGIKVAKGTAELDDRIKSPILQIRCGSRLASLNLHRKPTIVGHAWVKYDDDGSEAEVDLSVVRLLVLSAR